MFNVRELLYVLLLMIVVYGLFEFKSYLFTNKLLGQFLVIDFIFLPYICFKYYQKLKSKYMKLLTIFFYILSIPIYIYNCYLLYDDIKAFNNMGDLYYGIINITTIGESIFMPASERCITNGTEVVTLHSIIQIITENNIKV